MRCLHVIDTLRPSPVTAALVALLGTRLRLTGESDVHDVLAFGGGAADEALRARARRLFVAGAGLDVAAIVHGRAYDVIHAVDAASAHRIAPMILGSSATPFVYSGRGLARQPGPTFGRAADESLTAAADLTVLDAAVDAADGRTDLGSRLVRLDLARSGLLPVDGAALTVEALPPRAQSVLREWLACLARAAAA
ncbi:MAG: hypothetical protein ABIT71_10375 [Vicinamibacteraceae bacterium]